MSLVIVDTNEEATAPIVVARLRKFFPKLQVTQVDCGDIKIVLDSGQVLAVERKRAGDFLASIGDGRLFNQVERMSTGADWSCVVVEGLISFDKDDMAVIPVYNKSGTKVVRQELTGWRGVSVRAAMYAIQWSGCPIITIEPVHLPHMISDLMKFCSKPTEHTQSIKRKRYVTFPPPTIAETVLTAFPGVGMKATRSLLQLAATNNDNGVGTLAEALTWASALHQVSKKARPEGWGDKTILNFRTAMGLQPWEEFDVVVNEDTYKKIKATERKNGKDKK